MTDSALRFRALRVAVDRGVALYRTAVAPALWADLAERELLQVPDGRGASLALCRHGYADRRSAVVVWSGDGLHLTLRNPGVEIPQGQYPLKVEYQGLLCSSSTHGVEAILAARDQVEALLWPESGARADLRDTTVCGMTDICIDIGVTGPGADDWIERELFSNGNVDGAADVFSTRARATSRRQLARHAIGKQAPKETRFELKGTRAGGRSLYIGDDPQWIIYDKQKESARTKSRDGQLVRDRWREAGWDEERERVVRGEVSFTRAFLQNQTIPDPQPDNPKHAHSGKAIPFDLLMTLAGVFGATLAKRLRHTDRTDTHSRKKNRASSPLWRALERGLAEWDVELGGWIGVVDIKAVQREKHYERALKRLDFGVADLQLYHPEVSLTELARARGAHLDDEMRNETEYARKLYKRQELWAAKLGLGPPKKR